MKAGAMLRLSGASDLLANNQHLYSELCARPPGSRDNPTPRAIYKDVHRTFGITPEEAKTCGRCGRLRRILEAYSCLNQRLGYCQGLNFVAAQAMKMISGTNGEPRKDDGEECSFWLFVAMVQPLQGFWLPGTPAYLTAVQILRTEVETWMPDFHTLLGRHSLDVSMFSSSWLHCMYAYPGSLPPAVQAFAWDSMLHDGSEALFRMALALLQIIKSHLPIEPEAETILAMCKAPPSEVVPLEAVEEAYRQTRISGDGADRARALCEDYGDTWANRREGRSGVAQE